MAKGKKQGSSVAFVNKIQTRIVFMVIMTVVITSAMFLWTGIPKFTSSIEASVNSSMTALAQAYGAEMETLCTENDGNVPSVEEIDAVLNGVTVEGIEGSYAYMVDAQGVMLYHATAEKIGQPVENACVKNLVAGLAAGQHPSPTTVEYEFKGSTKLASYYILNNEQGILVISGDKDAAYKTITEFTTQNIIVTLFLIVVVSLIAFCVSANISKPIVKLTEVINKNAAYDFSDLATVAELSKGRSETGVMSQSLEIMQKNIGEMVKLLEDTASSLDNNAQGLGSIVEKLNADSCDNSATSEELAASMQETSATTTVIDEKMSSIDENSKKIAKLTADGQSSSAVIIDKAEKLRETSESATKKAEDIYSVVKRESDVAIEKARDIEKINALTDAIAAIASQTELLSLNASIEAARAGEAGRGFAVVAGEIGNLASQSTETANNITAIVSSVKDAAASMEKCLKQMTEFIDETVIADYQKFINVSGEYSNDAREFSHTMTTISDAISELEIGIEDIANSIEGINSTVNEASISINDIATKATDMVGMANDTGERADDNARYAAELNDIVGKFTI